MLQEIQTHSVIDDLSTISISPPTVKILASPPGSGHLSAAAAIDSALRILNENVVAENSNVFKQTTKLFQLLYGSVYFGLLEQGRSVYGGLHDMLDENFTGSSRSMDWFNRINTRSLQQELIEKQPSLIVCTHFLPAQVASSLKRRGKIDSEIFVVVTDFHAHSLWSIEGVSKYFVPHENTKKDLMRHNIREETISVSGIPVNPLFETEKDKGTSRQALGLKQEMPTVLITAGGAGNHSLSNAMRDILTIKQPTQFVVICGKSESLKTEMEALQVDLSRNNSKHSLVVVGFTNQMDEYMAASDLMVGKAGGLTLSEAFARKLPTVIYGDLPRHEELNARFLHSAGAAIYLRDHDLSGCIKTLFSNPSLLEDLQNGIASIRRPLACFQIAEQILKTNSSKSHRLVSDISRETV